MTNKLKTIKKLEAYSPFLTIPLVFLILIPTFLNQTGFPKLLGLLAGTLLLLIISPNLNINQNYPAMVLILMLALFLINEFIRPTSTTSFLIGNQGRYFGFITFCLFVFQYIYYSNLDLYSINNLIKIFIYTHILILFFLLTLIFDLLPVKESDNYGSLTGTFQNPNSLSAYLGIMIPFQIYLLLYKLLKFDFFQLFALLIGLLCLVATDSIQGYLILMINLFLILLIKYKVMIKSYKLGIFSVISVSLFVILFFINQIISLLVTEGSIKQRLNYWELTLTIIKENFWLGVGLDNLQESAFLLRDQGDVVQEGYNTAIDRAHNTILDFFAWGGFLIGSLWIIFIALVSIKAFKLLKKLWHGNSDPRIGIGPLIWIGYFIQSLISVSPLTLKLLGFVSAGLVYGASLSPSNTSSFRQSQNIKSKLSQKILVFLVILITFSPIYNYSKSEILSAKFVRNSDLTVIDELLTSKYYSYDSFERVMSKLIDMRYYERANRFAIKLSDSDPGRATSYFVKFLYFDLQQNYQDARVEVVKALALDKYNCFYLTGFSILETKLENFTNAKSQLELVEKICPLFPGLASSQQFLDRAMFEMKVSSE